MSQSIRERRAESLGRSIRIKQTTGKALSKRKLRANEKHRKQVAQISHRNGAVVDKGFDVFAKDLKIGTVQKRTSFMFSIVALLLVGLGVRVAMLQTVWAGEYRDASVSQRTRVQTLRAERGSILDRNGQELALPIPTRTVFADPRSVTDPIGVANAVGGILQLTDEAKLELSIKLRDQSSSFVYVARQADQRDPTRQPGPAAAPRHHLPRDRQRAPDRLREARRRRDDRHLRQPRSARPAGGLLRAAVVPRPAARLPGARPARRRGLRVDDGAQLPEPRARSDGTRAARRAANRRNRCSCGQGGGAGASKASNAGAGSAGTASGTAFLRGDANLFSARGACGAPRSLSHALSLFLSRALFLALSLALPSPCFLY